MGNIIGAGVFLLPAALAPFGRNAVVGWVVAVAGAACLAFVLARLAGTMRGGPYAFTERAFGAPAAFAVLWSYWISVWASMAAMTIAGVSALTYLLPPLARAPGVQPLVAVALLWAFALINLAGVSAAGRVQRITTLLKIAPLVAVPLVAAWATAAGEASGGLADAPVTPGGVAGAAALAMFAMLGFEAAAVSDARVRDARRVVPRATVAGALAAGALYLIACGGVFLLLPAERAAVSSAPFADAVAPFLGAGAARIVAGFAAVSALGALNGWILCAGEVLSTLAERGRLWAPLSNRRNGTPAAAQLISVVAATLLLLSNYGRTTTGLFAFVVLLSTVASLVLYAACSGAALRLDRSWVARAMASLGLGFSLWAMWGSGLEAVAWGMALLLTGWPLWWWARRAERIREK